VVVEAEEKNVPGAEGIPFSDELARVRRVRFGTAAELFDDLEKNSGK
jgi:hypothetical protein